MKIAIVDDDVSINDKTQQLISQWADHHKICVEIDQYVDGESFLAGEKRRVDSSSDSCYDLILLDIYMKEQNGINVAKNMRKRGRTAPVVFMTTSEDHRGDAFSVHAFDYLVKPIDAQALNQVLDELLSFNPDVNNPYLEVMVDRKNKIVLYRDITYIQSANHNCEIGINNHNPIMVYMPFNRLADELVKDPRFLPINRGIVVNMDYICELTEDSCFMRDGTAYPLNRKKSSSLRKTYTEYDLELRSVALSRRKDTV